MLHKIIFLLFCILLMLGTSESTADNLSIPIFRMNTTKKIVAITFDDGPHPVNSPLLLKVLRQEGVKATFFRVRQTSEKISLYH